MKCALADGFVNPSVSVFDYGCGHGEDVELLAAQGVRVAGWDPAFHPTQDVQEADVVNLGYVLNVIEDQSERTATLRRAWELARRLLVVSALVRVPGRGNVFTEFGDGVLTRRGTFQRFFEQGELREYLEKELGTTAIPATVGIFYVFRDESLREEYLEPVIDLWSAAR